MDEVLSRGPTEATGPGAHPLSIEREGAAPVLQCVWMLAGIVDYKLCDRDYECDHCPFDRALRERTREIAGEEGSSRSHGERTASHRLFSRGGFHMAEALFYHPTHVWARIERRGDVRIGLDDFGQKLLGRIYQVSFPEVGARVIAGRPLGKLAHQAGEIILSAPLTGVILQLNERLTRYPSLINHDPYGDGWLLLLRPERLRESLKHLLYGEQARSWYEREVSKLHRAVRAALRALGTPPEVSAAGRTLQDGGVPLEGECTAQEMLTRAAMESLMEVLGPARWEQVIARFLQPRIGRTVSAPRRRSPERR
ncbi:Glycine cleavage system H protein [bacterium HR10]|nr:Glycine cleavage system H protein [bacterium HR10]